ncbi:rolling circle replication-associated protein, partial [Nocardia mangyaensis]|uniref:rolling circle replication-associated protein n=1 Tax=Nocardia mangyaensis TaxID=2213200 RepID=UPI002674BE57
MVAIRLGSEDSLKRGGGAKRKNAEKSAMDESTLNKSIARAKVNVRRKAMSMNADRMLTLTFRENVTDIDTAWDCFKYFCKLMRFRYRDKFQYIAVPEYQKRGAVHVHVAINCYYHANTVRRFWHRAAGQFQGNIDITSPRKIAKNSWNPKRIANYLSKYLTKNDSVEFNRRRYSSGGKITLPEPIRGWLALGVPLISIMGDCIGKLTRKQVSCVWESEGYFGITYLST